MLCYYPGCSSHGIGKDMDEAVRAVAEKLGISFKEVEGWTCCGAGVVDDASPIGAAVLARGNLSLAKEQRCEKLFTACGICFFQFMKWKGKLKQNPQLREEVDDVLSAHHVEPGDVEVLHFIELLDEYLTEDHIVKPLSYLEVAIYPGCQAKRGLAAKGKNAFKLMEKIVRLTGAEVGPKIDFCCGFPVSTYDKRNSRLMAQEVVRRSGSADVIVTLCPFCQYHLDTIVKGKPVLHLHQLVGLAMGIDPKDLGLHRHNNKLEL